LSTTALSDPACGSSGWCRGGGANYGVDVFIRRGNDSEQSPNRRSITFVCESLSQHAFAARYELHDCLIGLDFSQHVASGDGVALVLVPLDEAAFFHRRRERLHHHFRCHSD
jgi:hypothetical protein